MIKCKKLLLAPININIAKIAILFSKLSRNVEKIGITTLSLKIPFPILAAIKQINMFINMLIPMTPGK